MLSAKRPDSGYTAQILSGPRLRSWARICRHFREVKNRSGFFYTRDADQPVIPGSSLRGTLRNLLEIVSYGKMQWVSKNQLFFRSLNDSGVGVSYRERMTHGRDVLVETGFLQPHGQAHVIKTCRMVRLYRDGSRNYRSTVKLGRQLYDGAEPNKTPRWTGQPYQHQPCWGRPRN